jgi:hypothetical protein
MASKKKDPQYDGRKNDPKRSDSARELTLTRRRQRAAKGRSKPR